MNQKTIEGLMPYSSKTWEEKYLDVDKCTRTKKKQDVSQTKNDHTFTKRYISVFFFIVMLYITDIDRMGDRKIERTHVSTSYGTYCMTVCNNYMRHERKTNRFCVLQIMSQNRNSMKTLWQK